MKKRILLLCLFSITLGYAYSQVINSHVTNKVVVSTTDKMSLIKADNLKKIWKPSYIHVISINSKANIKALIRLNKLLTEAPMLYDTQNTLILCDGKNLESVKEVAEGYNILQIPGLGSTDAAIIEGTLTPLTKEDNEPGYDFKFIEEKTI